MMCEEQKRNAPEGELIINQKDAGEIDIPSLQSNDKLDLFPSNDEGAVSTEQTISNEFNGIIKERLKRLNILENKIAYNFSNPELLRLALTHKSFIVGDANYLNCNERMEFLGDSVLALVVNSFLYDNFPEYNEGQLSKLKAVAVSRSTLASCARELDLGSFMLFGPGELFSGGSDKSSNLSNALEALIAAIYLDGGLGSAKEFIFRIFARKRTLKCLANFAPTQNSPSTKSRSGHALTLARSPAPAGRPVRPAPTQAERCTRDTGAPAQARRLKVIES